MFGTCLWLFVQSRSQTARERCSQKGMGSYWWHIQIKLRKEYHLVRAVLFALEYRNHYYGKRGL
jgi:hypothetical protein